MTSTTTCEPPAKHRTRLYAFNIYRSDDYWEQPGCILFEIDYATACSMRALISTCRTFIQAMQDKWTTVYTAIPVSHGKHLACLTEETARSQPWFEAFNEDPEYEHGTKPKDMTDEMTITPMVQIDWHMEARVERWELRIRLEDVWITCVDKDSSRYLETRLPEDIIARGGPICPGDPPYDPPQIMSPDQVPAGWTEVYTYPNGFANSFKDMMGWLRFYGLNPKFILGGNGYDPDRILLSEADVDCLREMQRHDPAKFGSPPAAS